MDSQQADSFRMHLMHVIPSFIPSLRTFSPPRVRHVHSRVRLYMSSCLGNRHTNCTTSVEDEFNGHVLEAHLMLVQSTAA